MPAINLTDDDVDWIRSHFSHRIALLGEYIADAKAGGDEDEAALLQEELDAAESICRRCRSCSRQVESDESIEFSTTPGVAR